jgi:hypothetical protein
VTVLFGERGIGGKRPWARPPSPVELRLPESASALFRGGRRGVDRARPRSLECGPRPRDPGDRHTTGIQFVTDEKGRKVGVPIDLRKHGAKLEDFSDGLISGYRLKDQSGPGETRSHA